MIDHEPRIWKQNEIALVKDVAAAVVTEITLRIHERSAATARGNGAER